MDQRADFEAWIIESGYRTRGEIDEEREMGDDYFTVLMSELWRGWQVAHGATGDGNG